MFIFCVLCVYVCVSVCVSVVCVCVCVMKMRVTAQYNPVVRIIQSYWNKATFSGAGRPGSSVGNLVTF